MTTRPPAGDLTHTYNSEIRTIRADEVQIGDVLLVEDCALTVSTINQMQIGYEYEKPPLWGHALHFVGGIAVIRFGHEMVRVLVAPLSR